MSLLKMDAVFQMQKELYKGFQVWWSVLNAGREIFSILFIFYCKNFLSNLYFSISSKDQCKVYVLQEVNIISSATMPLLIAVLLTLWWMVFLCDFKLMVLRVMYVKTCIVLKILSKKCLVKSIKFKLRISSHYF